MSSRIFTRVRLIDLNKVGNCFCAIPAWTNLSSTIHLLRRPHRVLPRANCRSHWEIPSNPTNLPEIITLHYNVNQKWNISVKTRRYKPNTATHSGVSEYMFHMPAEDTRTFPTPRVSRIPKPDDGIFFLPSFSRDVSHPESSFTHQLDPGWTSWLPDVPI